MAYKRVVNPELPEAVRFLALLWCIESYCWLTRQKFQATYVRLGKQLGFDWLNQPNHEQLLSVISLLQRERQKFLKKLVVFSETRKVEKARGKRELSEKQCQILYNPDWLETNES